jgi:NhaA family Na+:H+ antiporter
MLILCAVGGMACPAAIYLLFNWSLDSQIGWGIPMATDTAFALGALTIVRKHIPGSLLAFLVGLAIVDDIGAILVIPIFYTRELSLFHLLGAFALLAFLASGNYAGVRQSYFYIIFVVGTWWMMLKSGVHPTFSGVAIALTISARPKATSERLLDGAKATILSMQQQSKPVDVLGSRAGHDKVQGVRNSAASASTPPKCQIIDSGRVASFRSPRGVVSSIFCHKEKHRGRSCTLSILKFHSVLFLVTLCHRHHAAMLSCR